MSKVSIRQPVVLYSLVFTLVIAFAVVTLATFELTRATKRAYRRAVLHDLRAIAATNEVREIQRRIQLRPRNVEVEPAIVTATISAFGIDLDGAREEAEHPDDASAFVVVPLAISEPTATPQRWRLPPAEAYLVGRIDPSIPRSIALSAASRMIPIVLFGALACAALLAFMLGRLLLPALEHLAAIAAQPRVEGDGLDSSGAPNEILEVATRFRHTVRLLNKERELAEEQRNELERMQASLIRASKLASVGRLAAGIAHEIGNPLAAVQGYLDLLQGGLDANQQSEVLSRSSRELGRIHETIKKLLAYARGGEDVVEPSQVFSLNRVVADALELLQGHPHLRDTEIVSDLSPSTPIDVRGHAQRLSQVLVNLLLNAAHATQDSTVKRIRLAATRAEDGAVELIVEDTGPGVPTEDLEHIFDPFFTTKDPGEGTGLGLAVSRSLMEAMGGDLTIEAHPGEGARFKIRLVAA